MDSENTIFFKVEKEKKSNSKQILKQVYEALVEKGYNPINQIVGYIIHNMSGYWINQPILCQGLFNILEVALLIIIMEIIIIVLIQNYILDQHYI